ncbi:MAG: hypothetical protein ACJA2L_001809, partial [Polaribacter sp.]
FNFSSLFEQLVKSAIMIMIHPSTFFIFLFLTIKLNYKMHNAQLGCMI